MFNSSILEVIIGLLFLYLLFSLFATFLNEIISSIFKLRSNHLKTAIQNMMDNDTENGKIFFDKFYEHPLIQSFVKNKGKGFPSYLEPKKFAKVLVEIYEKEKNSKTKNDIKEALEKLSQHNYLRYLLLNYIEKGENKIENLEKDIEDWFNNVMERATGWYNRKFKKWTIAIAFLIALAFNFDTIHVYQRLSKDSKVRKELVQNANDNINEYSQYLEKEKSMDSTDTELIARIDTLKTKINTIINEEISSIEQLAGIGWKHGEWSLVFKNWKSAEFVIKIVGWMITAFAISLGAPFWFDLLNKVMKLRATGSKQELPKKPDQKK